jgi:multiple sugar transport system permease protein
MAVEALTVQHTAPSLAARLATSRGFAGFWFMLPALLVLGLFLVYPLGLGVWLSLTDTTIGRPGV